MALSRHLAPRLLMLCMVFCSALPMQVKAELVIGLEPATKSLEIASGIDYFVETRPMSAAQAMAATWQTITRKGINLHHEPNPAWFRFDVIRAPSAASKWTLEIPWPLLDMIELHVFDHMQQQWQTVQRSGNHIDNSERAFAHRHSVFPVALPQAGRYSIYLRASALSHFVVPIMLWQTDAFYEHDQRQLLLQGVLIGILAVMLLYNFSLYVFTADSSYFFYSAYVLAILFFVLSITGIGAERLWGHAEWLRRHSFWVSSAAAYLTATLFVRQFLSLKFYGGWLLQLNNVIAVYWTYALVAPFITVLIPHRSFLSLADLVGALSGLAGLVTTIYLWRRGNVSAKYFTIAWGVLIVSNMMFALMLEGILDRNPVTAYSLQFGFVIEVVLLSLVLAERINRERAARELAQVEALQLSQQFSDEREAKLAVQAEALAMQQAANDALESRVRARTAELEVAMQAVERFNLELKKLSITDALTGVYNRRFFEKTFADELDIAQRLRRPLSVIVLDIDHFKQINDAHGHLVGDECLKLIAAALGQHVTRPGDLVARYGGEEFAVLLPATTQDNAMKVADKLRNAVAGLEFISQGQRISLSTSLGVAGWVPQSTERHDHLIAAADAALYQAKKQGRNCTVAASR